MTIFYTKQTKGSNAWAPGGVVKQVPVSRDQLTRLLSLPEGATRIIYKNKNNEVYERRPFNV